MQKIIRFPRVHEITGLSRSTIDRKEKAGDFPRRVRLGLNSIGWREDEVLDWLENCQRGSARPPEKALKAKQKTSDRKSIGTNTA